MEILEESNKQKARKLYNKVGFALFIICIISIVIEVICIVFTLFIFKKPKSSLESNTYLIIVSLISLYLFAYPIGFFILNDLPIIETKIEKLNFKKFFLYLLPCFPIMYIGNIIGSILSFVLSNGNARNPLELFQGSNLFLTFILAVILAPCAEELIFRKQIIDHTKRFGEKWAILFSALAFGLFHMNFFQFFYAFGVGLILAYVYSKTNNIKYTILMHMLINFFGGVVGSLILSNINLDLLSSGQILSYVEERSEYGINLEYYKSLFILLTYESLISKLFISGIVVIAEYAKTIHFDSQPDEEGIDNGFVTRFVNPGVILFVILCIVMIVISLI